MFGCVSERTTKPLQRLFWQGIYSKQLRHLRRTQKIHLASSSEQLNQPDIESMLVNTLFQKADVFTKAVAGPLWENARKRLNILKDYTILHTSSTGLKVNFENLDEALGPSYGEVRPESKPLPKAAAKKRYKKKTQRILPYVKAPEASDESRCSSSFSERGR